MHPAYLCTVAFLTLAAAGTLADEAPRHHHDHDHDRARAALAGGEVRPIDEILASAAEAVPGDPIKVELEHEQGRWIYELKVIAEDGRRLEVLLDAATATVIEVEQD
jgi:uncharacterized membrane protein YkoI